MGTLWLSVVQRIQRAKFYSPPALCLLLRRSYPRTTESRTRKSFVFIDTSPFVRLRQVCLLAGHFFDHASDGFQSSSTDQKVTTKRFPIKTHHSIVREYDNHLVLSAKTKDNNKRMNKSSSTSVARPSPRQSAWAKGPPPNTSTASSPRSQSPAPISPATPTVNAAPTHSRRPSQLSGSFKDGIGVSANANLPRGNVQTNKPGMCAEKVLK